jgi:glutamate formiminotransferase/formiminotetrahydrofolate cyclodeaminase
MHDANSTINGFLTAAAARQPTPGGGSAAALAGALAASMGEMVVNYSVGKKSLASFHDELSAALGEFARARELLLGLMVEDQSAYEALTAARKLPDSAPNRQGDFDIALLASVRVPEAIGLTALALLELSERIVEKVNPLLLSDLAVCADLAMATVRCAIYNIKANLPDVADPQDRRRIEQIIARLQSHSLEIIQRLSPRIWQRLGQT